MTNVIVYSIIKEMQRTRDLVEQLRLALILAKMYDLDIDYDKADDVLVVLPAAMKYRQDLINSEFVHKIPDEIKRVLINAERIYREIMASLKNKVDLPIAVI